MTKSFILELLNQTELKASQWNSIFNTNEHVLFGLWDSEVTIMVRNSDDGRSKKKHWGLSSGSHRALRTVRDCLLTAQ